MKIPADTNIRIVVVENDLENHSESIVEAFKAQSNFSVSYHLETRQGIAFARNRTIKESGESDFCCFVDDDQIVDSDWLVELLKCQVDFNSDGVWGPNPPVFNKNVHSCIRKFYDSHSYIFDYGAIVNNAYTNCLLLRKKYLDMIPGPFDSRLNFSGGEDIFLTSQITKLGGIIRNNPNAVAYEIIPNDKATIKYIVKRSYRNSNTAYFVQSLADGDFNKVKVLTRLIMRLSLGLLIVIPFLLFGKSDRLKGIIKISDAIGGFSFIMKEENQFYK